MAIFRSNYSYSQAKDQLAKAKSISGGIPSENLIPTSLEEGTLTDQANKV